MHAHVDANKKRSAGRKEVGGRTIKGQQNKLFSPIIGRVEHNPS